MPQPYEPDDRWLGAVLHAAFFLLLGGALARFLTRHPGEPRAPWIIALSCALAVLHLLGPALAGGTAGAAPRGAGRQAPDRSRAARPPVSRPRPFPLSSWRAPAWLALVVAVWMVLVVLAPSYSWCAVPLFYTGLRTLPTGAALVLVAVLTAFVVAAQLRLAGHVDPNLLLAPPAVAATATAVFLHTRRQAARQRSLIDDLLRTRRDLAASERRAGTLAERQRLSMEIHDTLAQGLSSQRMLLQAAERVWESEPGKARGHVRSAASVAEHNLAEARRFVHDLAPADLARGGLDVALRALAAREGGDHLGVRVHIDAGVRPPLLPDRVQSALLRVAQGALANVREHAGATTAVLTLTLLEDQVVLDVTDDGRGFDPAAPAAAPAGPRGHGLPAMRARLGGLGGTLTIESAPGEGTVLSAAVPLEAPR
ncbi:sensor histidine kinase [Streptomyces longwoodensis]|uniref:sensor histidine kinase n=1 Tax=Streptomyces longwoodensis TaxID=68231 RepID=UPI002E81CC97|nr:sensor histidine kinase [Streptomyces longwoodensis]WUC55810.1 sensor histidine kinase [Streptomyces longwoodensis]WUC62071.1 sensor histidine kinase [Streptomyces longwoodensis]